MRSAARNCLFLAKKMHDPPETLISAKSAARDDYTTECTVHSQALVCLQFNCPRHVIIAHGKTGERHAGRI